ncbi:putative S-adenosylmethionine-dependent methyltransferase [uncultured archaeon]|nr:putative S-adenosylmethionine-dependent methyltransferase [uncultured archaeon]
MLGLYGFQIQTSGNVYEPAEDTFLLISALQNLNLEGKNVLEIGTGSGIIALVLAKKAKHVLAVDINPEAVKCAKENAEQNKIKNAEFHKSDLFANVKGILRNRESVRYTLGFFNRRLKSLPQGMISRQAGKSSKASNASERKFDLIVFNPPYLPDEPIYKNIALDGGKDGRQIIERFLKDAPKFLNPHGKIILLESSLSRYEKTLLHFKKIGFSAKAIARQKFDWEELVVIEAFKPV